MKKLYVYICIILGNSAVYGEVNCYQTAYGTECHAQVPEELAYTTTWETGGQYLNQWCWAASIETVFKQWGFDVRQDRIVQETYGGIVNFPAQPDAIMAQLNRNWIDDNGRSFTSSARHINISGAAAELANNKPVIIGYSHAQGGHAVVLESISYLTTASSSQVVGAAVSDPWPTSGGLRPLQGYEYSNINFMAGVTVAETSTSSDIIFDVLEQQFPDYFSPSASQTQVAEKAEGNYFIRYYPNGAGLYSYFGDLYYNLGNGWNYYGSLQKANEILCGNNCFF